ncbi:MAG: hypothetical protein JJT88_14775 [Gammaproteobacteria bacterium]|nr:hypothetical protein [Gammaproteobacteria bacterium]
MYATTGTIAFNAAVDAGSITALAGAGEFDVTFAEGPAVTGAGSFANAGGVTFNAGGSFDGGLSVSGGTTTLTGTLSTDGDPLTLGALTLAAAGALTSNGGAIMTGAVTSGGNAFTLNAGAGTIAVASLTGDGDLTVEDSAGAMFGALAANDILVEDTTGTIAFNAAANAASITALAGAGEFDVTFAEGPVVSGAGSFANAGGVTFNAGGSFGGGLSVSGGTTTLTGTLSTDDDPLTLGALTLAGAGTLSSGGGDITTGAVTSGGQAFTLNAGDGTIAVASFAGVGDLTVQDSGGATFGEVGAAAILLEDTTGTILFDDAVAAASITAEDGSGGFGVTFSTTPIVTGASSFANTGGVTFNAGGNFIGGLSVTGGPTVLTGTLLTDVAALSLGALTLNGPATLTSGGGAITTGDITSNAHTLTLNAGATGQITVASLGAGGDLTIQNSGGATFTGSLDAETVTLTNTNGLIAFEGDTAIGTAFVTAAAGYDLAFTGTTNTVAGATEFLNTGSLTLGDAAGDSITFADGLTALAPSSRSIAGTVATNDADLTLGATTLTADSRLTTGSGGGNVSVGDVAAASHGLSLNAGAGTIDVAAFLGGGDLTVENSVGTMFGAVAASDILLEDTTGTIAFNAAVDAGSITALAGAGEFDVTFAEGPAVTGAGSFANAGGVTFEDGGSFDGGLTVAGTTTLEGMLSTANNALMLGALTLNDAVTLASGGGAITTGAITSNAHTLTLSAGATGQITVALLGGGGDLTIENSGGATFTGSVDAETVTLTNTSGVIAFQGDTAIGTALVTAAEGYGLAFTGTTNTVAGATEILNTGSLTLGDAAGDSITFAGGLTATAPSSRSIAGTVATNEAGLLLGATTLTANSTLTTGAGGGNITTGALSRTNQSLTLNAGTGTVNVASINGTGALTLNSSSGATFGAVGAGAIALNDNTNTVAFNNAVTATSITAQAEDFAITFAQGPNVSGAGAFQNTNGVTFAAGGSFNGGLTVAGTTTLAGMLATNNNALNLNSAVNLTGNSTLASNGGAITTAAIDAANNNLTLNAGAGGTTSIASFANGGNLTVANSNSTTIAGNVVAADIALQNSSDTIAFQGGVTAANITAANAAFTTTFAASPAVSGSGNFENAGGVTFAAGGNFNGGLTVAGTTTLTGTLATSGNGMNLGSVTAAGPMTLTTGAGAGSITTGAITRGTNALTLNAGTGLIEVASVAGAGDLTLVNSGGATFSGAVTAGELELQNSAGTVEFGAGVTAASIDAQAGGGGYGVTFAGTPTVSGSGSFANAGGVVFQTGGSFGGGVSVTGTTTLAGTLSTDAAAMQLAALTLSDAATLASAGGQISTGAVSSNGNGLTLNAGAGDIQVASLGGNGALTVANAGDATFAGPVAASTVNLNAASGSIAFRGNTTISSGLNVAANGFDVAFTGTTNTVAGMTEFQNTGTVTFGDAAGDSITFAGGVDTTATSGTRLAGTLATTNTELTLGGLTLTGAGTLRSGSGTIQVGSVSGAGQTLNLQVDTAGSTGAVVVNGAVTVGTLNTFAQGYDVSLLGGGNVMSATTFRNLGALTLGNAAGDNLTFAGGLTATAPSALNLAGAIATTNSSMQLRAANLTAATSLVTGTTGAGGTLQTGALSAGGNALTLRAGTSGNINVASISNAGAVAFPSAGNVTISGGLQAGSATVGDVGSFTVQGPLNLNSLQTQANAASLTFTGGGTVTESVVLANTGGLTLGDGGDSFLFAGGLDSSAGSLTLNGTLRTGSAPLTTAGLNVAGDSNIDTTNDGDQLVAGAMVRLGAVSGVAGSEVLTIDAGIGDIFVDQGVSNLGSFFVFSGNEMTLGDVSTNGNSIRTVTRDDVFLNGNLTAANGDVSIITTGGRIIQATDTRVTSARGDANLVAFDQIDVFEVHAPQGNIFLALLTPGMGGAFNRIGPVARTSPDFVAGGLLAVVSTGQARLGSTASGFRVNAPESFISLQDGQSFVDETNALTLANLGVAQQQSLVAVFDQTQGLRPAELAFDQQLFGPLSGVITGAARAQQALSERAQAQSQAATQQADEVEVLTDITEDVFIEIALFDFDREQPLCLPEALQGPAAAPCAGQEEAVAVWFDQLASDLLAAASGEPQAPQFVLQPRSTPSAQISGGK